MTVRLPIPLEEFIRRKIAAGEFQSADEVVCAGLKLLQQEESWRADARKKIDVGWEQAKAGQLRTPEETRDNLAALKADWKSRRAR